MTHVHLCHDVLRLCVFRQSQHFVWKDQRKLPLLAEISVQGQVTWSCKSLITKHSWLAFATDTKVVVQVHRRQLAGLPAFHCQETGGSTRMEALGGASLPASLAGLHADVIVATAAQMRSVQEILESLQAHLLHHSRSPLCPPPRPFHVSRGVLVQCTRQTVCPDRALLAFRREM